MSNKNNNEFETIDNLFDKFIHDDEFRNSSLKDFGDTVQNSMNDSAKKQGYDTFADMLVNSISAGLTNKKPRKPQAAKVDNISSISRYDHVLKALEAVRYEQKYKGYYEEGHSECLRLYKGIMKENQDNLCIVEDDIKQDLKITQKRLRKNNKDVYSKGYNDALILLTDILLKSKKSKMIDIKKIMTKIKKRG